MNTISTTIGFNPKHFSKNGEVLKNISNEELSQLAVLNQNKDKSQLFGIHTYSGVKGNFTGSNVYFVDIDSKVDVDWVFEHTNEIFLCCPDVLFMQKSFSGKLHAVGVMHNTFTDKEEYTYWSRIYTTKFLAAVNLVSKSERQTELNYFTIPGAVDSHNTNWFQALYMSADKIFFNESVIVPSGAPMNTQEIVAYITSLGLNWFQKKVQRKQISKSDVNYTFGEEQTGKITVNKDFAQSLGFEGGDDLRWKLMSTLKSMFGESAEEVVYKYFANANEIIKSCTNEYGEFPKVKSWLMDTLGIQMKINQPEQTKEEINWMTDVKDEIIKAFKTYKRIEVTAPTGSGKTYLINNILAKELNAVVIVPYNATNALYSNLVEVSTSSGNAYTKDAPVVMIPDQAVKYDLTDRVVIIDESHTLFQERTFRQSSIKLMEILKNEQIQIISFSATPTGEVDELNLHSIEFYKHRENPIRLSAVYTQSDIPLKQKRLIKYHMLSGRYDKIAVFDNRSMKKIYENLVVDGYSADVDYIRSSTQETPEFKRIKTEEMLNKRVTLLTGIAYNGLNFRNTERILVLMEFIPGETLYSEIIQSIGRFRNAKQVDVVLFIKNTEQSEKHSVKELAEKANDLYNAGISSDEISYTVELTDKMVVNAWNYVEEYVQANGQWSVAKEQILRTGYVYIEEFKDDDDFKGTLQLKIKRKISNSWKADFLNNERGEDSDNPYYVAWNRSVSKILWDYEVIDKEWIKGIITSSKGELLVDTILNNVRDILLVGSMNDEDWRTHQGMLNGILMQANKQDKWYCSELSTRIKKLESIREKYGFIGKDLSGWFRSIECDFDKLFNEYLAEKSKAGSCGGKVGGKLSSPKKAVVVVFNDEEHSFDSKGDADAWLKTQGLSQKQLGMFKTNKKCYKVL